MAEAIAMKTPRIARTTTIALVAIVNSSVPGYTRSIRVKACNVT